MKELKKIYKVPILAKLRLSKNFPKDLLYTRKSFLRVGLISQETAIVIAKIKEYLGYKRVYQNVKNMIKIGEEMVELFSGTRKQWDKIKSRYWKPL